MDGTGRELMEIVVNGERRSVPSGQTVLNLLLGMEMDPERVAVELDREILRRPRWAQTPLREGSSLEIVHFVGGG